MEADKLRGLGLDLGDARVCVSDRVQAPVAVGFLKPAVVIPDWLILEISPSQLRQVIIHELTHLRRRDDWTNLAQKILAAVLFFHPVVWWIERKLALERELACDDAVLARSADARGYAECLVRLAEKSFMRRGIAMAQAAVSRLRHTSLRVAQILDGRSRSGRRSKPALIAVAGLAAAFVALSLNAPVLIGFQTATNTGSESATEAVARTPNPVHQAGFIPASAPSRQMMAVRPQEIAVRLQQKSLVTPVVARVPRTVTRANVVSARLNQSPNPNQGNVGFVSSESLIVLVSAPAPGQVQVQMWRITVLRPATQPDYVPRKTI